MSYGITYMRNLFFFFKKLTSKKQKIEWWLARAGERLKWTEVSQIVHTLNLKKNKF